MEAGAGMLWQALWALIFGYVISAGIQVLVRREQMARALGERSMRKVGLASFFGFISSSCSFAALAASRTIFAKGAHPANSIAFLIASTNLVIELGVVLWVLVGWRFTLGNFLLGLFMILYAYILTGFWFPKQIAKKARDQAKHKQEEDDGEADDDDRSWREKLFSSEGWVGIAHAFVREWKMVWKELLFGFTIAGFISVFVPQSVWNALFMISGDPASSPGFLTVVENALVAPVVAFFTFIGSMGNIPLAAMLWSKNASFGGVMSFLGADLVAATVIWIHVKYYGWRYALYLSALLYLCMVAAGITVHYLFELTGLMPHSRPAVEDMVRFSIDYTFFLNLGFLTAGTLLFVLHFRARTKCSD
jgi:uncharacterized protein